MSKKRRMKELTEADIAACEPESIWLETRRCPLPAHAVLGTVLLMLAAAVVWACVAKVDKVVTAEGKLVTTRPNITLKPYERSVVREVLATPGQVVEAGQTLVTFDTTVSSSELHSLREQRDTAECGRLRLLAEKSGIPLALPEELAETGAGRTQRHIFEARAAFHARKVRHYDENIARYRETSTTMRASFAKYEEMLKPMKLIEDMYSRLSEQGMAARADLLQVQMQRLGNEIEVENQRARLVENEKLELATVAEKEVFLAEWRKEIAEKLEEAELKIVTLDQRIQEVAYLASIECMKSPCRAVVHEVAPFQDGSGVREAEAMMTLIPLDVPLEAEVDILPRDVGRIRPGDNARLKLEAFPFQQHGTLNGTVRVISADTYESASNLNEDAGSPPAGGKQQQYRARLAVSGKLERIPESLWSSSGMKLQAEIKVGERRVISYLLNPFLKAMDESIREP